MKLLLAAVMLAGCAGGGGDKGMGTTSNQPTQAVVVETIDQAVAAKGKLALVKGTAPVPAKTEPASEKPAVEAAAAEKPADDTKAGPLRVDVGPITADKGALSVGRLHLPKDRYAKCVEDNGGLEGNEGEVQVRFLVRGEVSRAEGVSVSKRRNMSKEAAKCVADVVDRRQVGTPDTPMVGATLTIKFSH